MPPKTFSPEQSVWLAPDSDARYRSLFENSMDGILLTSPDGRSFDANPSACSILQRTREQIIASTRGDLIDTSDPAFARMVEERKRTGKTHGELIALCLDGSKVPVEISSVVFQDTEGHEFTCTLIRDISRRKAAEVEREQAQKEREELVRKEAALEARLRLAAIVESSDDAIIGKDMDGIITDWNKGAERLYGYSADEIIGQSVSLLIPPDRTNELFEILGTVKRWNRINNYETMRRRKDGTHVQVALTVSPMIDPQGGTVGASAIARDITERKRAEEALRESEERLVLAAQAGKMYAYEWDVATDTITRSPEYVNILGFSGPPMQLTRYQILDRVHPDDRALLIGSVDQVTPANPTTQISYRMLRPDGAVIWLETHGRAFFDTQGGLVRIIGMAADITERKLAEEALANVSRKLIEAQEQERARIARELHDDIVQRLVMLNIGLEELQQNSHDSLAGPDQRIRELREQTTKIIDDVQSLSHELHSSKLEALGMGAAMRGFCREFGEHEKVEIDFEVHDLPGSLSPTIGLCLFRVLQEALRNATKHSGVRHFEVRSWGTSDQVHLTVSDSGAGFDCKAAKESRGLGLVSMEERLKLVKGNFSIESQPKRGTTIHARVPFSSGFGTRPHPERQLS
jgi:PAS domain S-box-containing protein